MMDDFDDFEEFEDFEQDVFEQRGEQSVTAFPTLKYFLQTYAQSMGGEDQKACGAFKQYESQEKLRRLQQELIQIKDEKASEQILDTIAGKKRKAKHASYKHWAELMLLWIAAARY